MYYGSSKNVLITGASKGLGFKIAETLIQKVQTYLFVRVIK